MVWCGGDAKGGVSKANRHDYGILVKKKNPLDPQPVLFCFFLVIGVVFASLLFFVNWVVVVLCLLSLCVCEREREREREREQKI